jgi:hypothetical protein
VEFSLLPLLESFEALALLLAKFIKDEQFDVLSDY